MIVEYLDRSDDAFFLTSGQAHAIVYSLVCKIISFRDLEPGELFGKYVIQNSHRRNQCSLCVTSENWFSYLN
jgi:hypothetical protein